MSGDALPAVMRAVGPEGRLQPGQGLEARVRADALVTRETIDRQHQVVVEAVLPCLRGQVVRRHRERVLPLPADPELVGELLVALAQRGGPLLRHPGVDQPPAEGRRHQRLVAGGEAAGRLRQYPRRSAHGLDPARDDEVRVARLHQPGRVHRCLQAASTEPVDGQAGDAHGQSRQQHGHPADVAVVLAGAVGATEDHVVDPCRVDLGRTVEQAAHDRRRQVVGSAAGQGPGVPAERRADTGIEERVAHVGPVGLEPTTHRSEPRREDRGASGSIRREPRQAVAHLRRPAEYPGVTRPRRAEAVAGRAPPAWGPGRAGRQTRSPTELLRRRPRHPRRTWLGPGRPSVRGRTLPARRGCRRSAR